MPWQTDGLRIQKRVLLFSAFLKLNKNRSDSTGINTPFGKFREPPHIVDMGDLEANQQAETKRDDGNHNITDQIHHDIYLHFRNPGIFMIRGPFH